MRAEQAPDEPHALLQAVENWMQALEAQEYKPILVSLFDKYVEPTLAHCRRAFKTVVPLPAINQAQTLCKILEGILPKVLSMWVLLCMKSVVMIAQHQLS